ncbi:MAG: hypothetical protein LC650_00445 [Actinobacteria bacterium]|nr:hypothetical protein [Actinomycetota bacterium]
MNLVGRHSYIRREFLNREGHHTLASILATILASKKEVKTWMDAEIVITDCYRAITLEFDAYDKEDYENSVEKLDKLISTLTEFREAYVEQATTVVWKEPK